MGATDRWGVVFDCDGTLFERKHVSLMHVLDGRKLTLEQRQVMLDMRAQFLERAIRNELTPQEESDWLERTLEVYVRAGLTQEDLRAAMSGVTLRRGVKRCLRLLRRAGVPVGVVSYGVEQLIDAALEINGALNLVSAIYAVRLTPNDSGRFVGFDRGTYVLPSNKSQWSRRFAERYGIDDNHLLAVGDSAVDANLGILKENRLGIAETDEQAAQIRPFMSEVVISMNFGPVTDWLLNKIGSG